MATVVVCGGLGSIKRDVVPVGLAHALASERLRQATTDCSKDLTRSASLASLATSGSLNSLNDDDVGPMFNDDGSAVDPDEFRRWLMANPEKMKELEKEEHKDVAQLLLGGDNAKTQDCLRKMFALQMKHAEEDEQSKMSSPDLLRTECTVPRDPVVLYQQMLKVGGGPGHAFRMEGRMRE